MSGLPKGWAKIPLEELAIFSPKHDAVAPETDVSFAMPAVCEHSGEIIAHETRQLSAVARGYTHFKNGDVLFAKIIGRNAVAILTLRGETEGASWQVWPNPDAVAPGAIHETGAYFFELRGKLLRRPRRTC